jgi:hypothetical protein
MPWGRQQFYFEVAQREDIAAARMDCDMRSGGVPLHHHLRISKLGNVKSAAAMVGVRMCIRDVVEAEAMIGGDRYIATGIFF